MRPHCLIRAEVGVHPHIRVIRRHLGTLLTEGAQRGRSYGEVIGVRKGPNLLTTRTETIRSPTRFEPREKRVHGENEEERGQGVSLHGASAAVGYRVGVALWRPDHDARTFI